MSSAQHSHHPHSHSFGQDQKRPGEIRTIIVIIVTATMMVVEIAAGIVFGSMALLADGLHMASHAAALSINAFAYIYARRNAHSERYSFGTGKVNALGGFSGAILLAIFALIMVGESVARFIHPVEISYDQAILVAVLGLIVNGVSVFILDHKHDDEGGHHHHHGHHHHDHHGHDHHHGHQDHNLRAAYLHVLADALTSLLAIGALLAAKYAGVDWMDPLMGIVGAVLVARWSIGLLRTTSGILLDEQGPEPIRSAIAQQLQTNGDRIVDLHVWSIGPGIYSAILSLVTSDPRPPEYYKGKMPSDLGVVHWTIEVHQESETT